MLKPLTQILGVTWLIWLYSNTSIRSIVNFPPPQPDAFVSATSSMQVGLNLLKTLTPQIQPLLTANTSMLEQPRLEVRLSQRRVVLFRGNIAVRSYPIAIGQSGWETPTGQFRVKHMQRDPDWIHPLTDEKVPNQDLRNPLGRHWIGFWTDGRNWIGFHGTPQPNSVGYALSHGCLRMRDPDIDEIYYQVSTGTPVTVKP
jgi:lipoprotein-anchoring transpeptidase ErfK/SrfK